MFHTIAVGDVMTRSIISVKPSANLYDCAREMIKKRINTLLIAEKQKLIGLVTARDVMWTITKKPGIDLKKINVMKVATKKVAVTKPSADIRQALEKMKQLGFKRLPVLANGNLVGILTLKDILRVDPTLYQEIGRLEEIREESLKLKKLSEEWDSEGLCVECGAFAPLLKVEGRLLCPDCRDELY